MSNYALPHPTQRCKVCVDQEVMSGYAIYKQQSLPLSFFEQIQLEQLTISHLIDHAFLGEILMTNLKP